MCSCAHASHKCDPLDAIASHATTGTAAPTIGGTDAAVGSNKRMLYDECYMTCPSNIFAYWSDIERYREGFTGIRRVGSVHCAQQLTEKKDLIRRTR